MSTLNSSNSTSSGSMPALITVPRLPAGTPGVIPRDRVDSTRSPRGNSCCTTRLPLVLELGGGRGRPRGQGHGAGLGVRSPVADVGDVALERRQLKQYRLGRPGPADGHLDRGSGAL